MKFSGLDYLTLAAYLVIVLIFGSYFSRRQRSSTDYFLGGKNLPWGAVAFSIVAAETSTLTFISIPGLAYISDLGFLQLAFGYIIGRIIISFVLLPAYARGKLMTAYELLGNRFGPTLRKFAALVFQFTRLLADGVRLFATAIPLAIITGWNYPTSILVIGLIAILYTYFGGIKAVVWLDLLQMSIYFVSALLAGFVILQALPDGFDTAIAASASTDKFRVLNLGFEGGLKEFFSINYTLISGILGGAFLSMASHGTDQLIVQKLFSCRDLKSSQKALITSGVLVFIQFALFLMVGVLLYAYYGGVEMRSDEIFPRFIVEGLPQGLSGFIIAGIFAAAMSTLSASLNALAATSMNDLLKPKLRRALTDAKELLYSRLFTLVWGIVFVAGAMFFKEKENPVVELGLGIASFTYGGMLGVFFLGIMSKKAREQDALLAMWTAIFFMTWVIAVEGIILTALTILNLITAIWMFARMESRVHKFSILVLGSIILSLITLVEPAKISWPWFVLIGTIVTIAVGNTVANFGKNK